MCSTEKGKVLAPEHVNCIISHNRDASKKKDVPEKVRPWVNLLSYVYGHT